MTTTIENAGQALSAEQLHATEVRLGIEFPDDYRSFLLSHNGGEPKPGWFRYGKDKGDVAEITRFWAVAEVESETKGLWTSHGVPAHFVSIGAVSDEEALMLSVSLQDPGAVFWNANNDYIDASEFSRIAESFSALLTSLDYLEDTKPWMMLIDNNDLEGFRRWLDAGGDARAEEDLVLGIRAVEHAAFKGRREMVELLIARGAKPRGAALYAAQAGHEEIAAWLRPLTKPWWKFWASG